MPTAKTPEPLVRAYRFKPEQRSYARDIDTYVKPQGKQIAAPTGPTRAERLAASLRGLSPILEKYFTDREEQRQKELSAAGERAQKENVKKNWLDYLRDNPEAEKYGPYFREGYEKQEAILRGVEYNQYLTELRTTDKAYAAIKDPQEAGAYLRAKGAEWLKKNAADINDRAVQEYLLTAVNQSDSYHTAQGTDERLDEMVQKKTDMFQTVVSSAVEEMTARGEPVEQQAAMISAHIQNTILDGTAPAKVNDAAIDALTELMQRKAREGDMNGAAGAKAVLEHLQGRDGAPLSKIMRYRSAIDDAWEKVGDEAYAQISRDRQLKEWEREDAAREVREKYAAEIYANPTKDYSALLASVAAESGPDAAKALEGDIGTALGYQRAHRAYLKGEAGTETDNKKLKNSLLALSYIRPLTDSESTALAEAGATASQVMNARSGKNVIDDGSYEMAEDLVKKIIGTQETDWGVRELEQAKALRGEILADWQSHQNAYQKQHDRVPSKIEQKEYFNSWLIQYKTNEQEARKAKETEKEKTDKIDKAITSNNENILFKSLPKMSPELLQSLIEEADAKGEN